MGGSLSKKIPVGLFRFLWARLFNVKYPHAIQFNITFRCNQRCIYCGIHEDTRSEMSTEEVHRMLDQFAELGTARLSLTGGEPLLRKDLPHVVHHARKKGMFVSLATNGSLLPQRLDALAEINSINMTLDGPEEVHDKQRGRGNFRKVMQAAEAIRSRNIPFYFVCVLTKNNCAILDEVLKTAKSVDAKVLIQPVFYAEHSHAGNREGYESAKYEEQAMLTALDRILTLKRQKDPHVMLSSRYYRDVMQLIQKGTTRKCSTAGSLFCTISPDGRVAPCNLLVRDMRWLNGNITGFRHAFIHMPSAGCGGCISSFLDIDDLYSLKSDVIWNYYQLYRRMFRSE